MSIKQTPSGWKVDFRAGGSNGKRYRKTCKTKAEAERYQKFVEAQETTTGKAWNPKPKDSRRLLELLEPWFLLHGQHLKDGERRLSKLRLITEKLSNPIAADLQPLTFSRYRATRTKEGIKPKTLNNELGYINSLFNSLRKSGEIDYANPLAEIDNIKVPENELSYLTTDQIETLLSALDKCQNPHAKLITLICLSTGARWGEAEGITTQTIHHNRLTFTDTKNGKNRTVPISQWLFDELLTHARKSASNNVFTSSIGAFRRALKRSKIELPAGQAAHVLRHTFASHFMINGGNILTLQRILGHSDIRMTMRYSHLSPDHLLDALTLNPLDKHGITGIKKAAD
ncbi:phage integrase [Marinomonas foliarum]|uniref:Site-specific recombinase XerD n=1 Tax=Marinomonas foliarum TaxID=491950 RepID=A0A369AD34_9GAMM|nr:tyrosine-type recombinase/integrase [Marinomonas foliarum]RCX07035.1 site-specific recombinase XerD [Marinomonas foliarum]